MRVKIIPVLLFSLLFCSCSKMRDPVFMGIENVRMNGVGLAASMVTLDIRYLNPNKFQGRLKQAEGDAWIDSVYLGHFLVDTLVDIPANSEFLVPVKLSLDMKQLLKHSLTSFQQDSVKLVINGRAKAGRSGVYKNFSLNYAGMQNLKALFK